MVQAAIRPPAVEGIAEPILLQEIFGHSRRLRTEAPVVTGQPQIADSGREAVFGSPRRQKGAGAGCIQHEHLQGGASIVASKGDAGKEGRTHIFGSPRRLRHDGTSSLEPLPRWLPPQQAAAPCLSCPQCGTVVAVPGERIEEPVIHREIFNTHRRVLAPANLGSGSVPSRVSIATEGLLGSDGAQSSSPRSRYRKDLGQAELFCSPRQRLRGGGTFKTDPALLGALTAASRWGRSDDLEALGRRDIFGTSRRVRSASPEAMAAAAPAVWGRSAGPGPGLVVEAAASDDVGGGSLQSVAREVVAPAVSSNMEAQVSTSVASAMKADASESGQLVGPSCVVADEVAGTATPASPDLPESPRTLRKSVPDYCTRHGENLSGSTLAIPACSAWRNGGTGMALGGGGGRGGGLFVNRDLSSSNSTGAREETWRSLLQILYQQPLQSEALDVLHEFDHRAVELERSLQEQLHAERLGHEESWRAQRSSQRLKPSSHLLQLRVVEKALAKARDYAEAARVQRDREKLEKVELARQEREFDEKVRKLDADLRRQEQVAVANLQKSLREELWYRHVNGEIPAPV